MSENFKIIGLMAENFKPLRIVEIDPKNRRVVKLTGRNGQGKSSVLDAIFFALKGQKALPDKKASMVRRGAEKATVKLRVSNGEDLEFDIVRTLGTSGNPPTIEIVMRKGKRDMTAQHFIDKLFGALTFDPLAFVRMTTQEQIVELRKTAKVDVDFDKIAAENKADYDARKDIGKERDRLSGEIAGLHTLEGLPEEKLNEAAILEKLEKAGEANNKAKEIFSAKQELGAAAARLGVEKIEQERRINNQRVVIQEIQKQLDRANQELTAMEQNSVVLGQQQQEAQARFDAAPAGDFIDVTALTMELQSAQRTNRAIDAKRYKDQVVKKRDELAAKYNDLTRRIDAREEKKRVAISKAKIPVEGLTFDENGVLFNGLPLENLGEGEQIRISTLIGMAANPKLRVICIRNGEALDDEGMKVIAQLAEEHDFQVWMALVDTSGKVGIVLQDGMIAAENEEEAS